jgi:hypothetical protein
MALPADNEHRAQGPCHCGDKTALIKSLKEPEDKIGEPSPIRGNKFSHLSLEDFKETDDETFAWESFEKKLSAYSFLKLLDKKSLTTNSKTG